MEIETKRIKVERPFTYYLNGYQRRDFEIGEHDVPYDCAAYAERAGFTRRPVEAKAEDMQPHEIEAEVALNEPEVSDDGRARKPRRAKAAS